MHFYTLTLTQLCSKLHSIIHQLLRKLKVVYNIFFTFAHVASKLKFIVFKFVETGEQFPNLYGNAHCGNSSVSTIQ